MADLGKAYVQIVPSAKGIKANLAKELSGETAGLGESLAGSIFGKLKGAAAKLAIGGAIAASFKEAISEGAKLQQSIGGIETLYSTKLGDASKKVIENAKVAYRTAGLSANEYMEQATTFAAGLVSACGGNANQAADVANMALIDMADNANKMGTDMEAIQNAYQGFAKQNYTMLDNLKLGYGGTKEEMQRLLEDAQKLTGVKYDIDNLSDVYSAIHAIQENLGVTGTTAKEAGSTFSGSFAQMKAAAQNLLGYMATGMDIGPAVQDLASSVSTFVFGNAIPMILEVAKAAPQAIGGLMTTAIPIIAEKAPELFLSLMDAVGDLALWLIDNGPKLATDLWNGLMDGLSNLIPKMAEKGSEIINKIKEGMDRQIPGLSDSFELILGLVTSIGTGFAGWKISTSLASGITGLISPAKTFFGLIGGGTGPFDALTLMLSEGKGALASFATNMINAGGGIKGFGSALTSLAGGPVGLIIGAITAAVAAVVYFYNTNEDFRNFVQKCWAEIQKACQTLVKNVVSFFTNLGTNIQELCKNIAVWWTNLITSTKNLWNQILQAISTAVKNIQTTVTNIFNAVSAFVTNIFNTIKNTTSTIWNAIKTTISNIINGIKNTVTSVFNAVSSFITSIFNTIKNTVTNIWNAIKTAITNAVNSIQTTITNVFNAVSSFITSVFNTIKNTASNSWNTIKTTITNIVNGIKNTVTSVFNAVSSFITSIFNTIKNTASSIWNAVLSAISNIVNSIRNTVVSVFNGVSSSVSSIFNGIRNTASSIWNGISSAISSVVNGVRNTVSNVFSSLSGTLSGVWNGIRNTASSVWNGVRSAIEGPINTAKNIVQNAVNTIKGFFNFRISWPHIPMPHFTISPSGWKIGDLLKGSIPSLGISWYAKAMNDPMLFSNPAIFGMNRNGFLGAGEAGDEIMYGHENLMRDIANATASGSQPTASMLQEIALMLQEIMKRMENMKIEMNDRELGRVVRKLV